MQNNSQSPPVRVYKRSYSGGRELDETTPATNDNKNCTNDSSKDKNALPKSIENQRESSVDRNGVIYRRSASRGRCDYDGDTKPRNNSASKTPDSYNKSLCSAYSSDVSDKYKYYSPYLGKKAEVDSSLLPYKPYENVQRNSCLSPTKDIYGRPPSGCLSPPPLSTNADGTLRRRSTQRRISRFLRPDFFEQSREESAYLQEKKRRERETQSVLREIRERSRERSRDRRNEYENENKNLEIKKDNYLNKENPEQIINLRHVRNKSLERFCEPTDIEKDIPQRRRRSLSRPREATDEQLEYMDKTEIANKILEELQILSAAKSRYNQIETLSKSSSENNNNKENVLKIKKTKSKEKSDEKSLIGENEKNNGISTIKKTVKVKKEKKVDTKPSESIEEPKLLNVDQPKVTEVDKSKRESKLIRPKSYPSKDPEKAQLSVAPTNGDTIQNKDVKVPSKITINDLKDYKIIRPKSFPNSKIAPPKEVKKTNRSSNAISAVVERFLEKVDEPNQLKIVNSKSNIVEDKLASSKSSDTSSSETKKVTKKVVKIAKKPKTENELKSEETQKEVTISSIPQVKEKSPEKKSGKGLLYAIGQKFEKLRENAKNKDKKLNATNLPLVDAVNQKDDQTNEPAEKTKTIVKKKKIKTATNENGEKSEEKSGKSDKKSRIDSMIRSLRERSITRMPVMTESGLIKRAVSVEDMSGAFNKSSVNKVLGLFKKFEKDDSERKVMNTRSTSNIERQMKDSISQKDRPKSSGFVSKLRKNPSSFLTGKDSSSIKSDVSAEKKPEITPSSDVPSVPLQNKCPDCGEQQDVVVPTKKNIDKDTKPISTDLNSIKDKRKELTLDFSKIDNLSNKHRNYLNGNHINHNYVGDISYASYNNNNNFLLGCHEINRNNLLTPSNENIANYSSDSRSPHDDCASSSTFLSPSDEPELCFDSWSICSEDNFTSTPSPTISRLSRTSQLSSPIEGGHPESVIDRIKRRSFYCRFNEKKPKRQSSIVGPAAREYYRESAAKLRSRPPDRVLSPELETMRTTHEYFKPLQLSSASNDLKPPHLKSSIVDYSKPRKSLNDLYPPTVQIGASSTPSINNKRYTENDYIRSRNPSLESNGTSFYNTYTTPKRRSSFTVNGVVSTGNSNIDGYATLSRRLRPYEQRSVTTTNMDASQSNIGTLRRDQRTPTDFGNLPRSNLHLRNPSVCRSPTNI